MNPEILWEVIRQLRLELSRVELELVTMQTIVEHVAATQYHGDHPSAVGYALRPLIDAARDALRAKQQNGGAL